MLQQFFCKDIDCFRVVVQFIRDNDKGFFFFRTGCSSVLSLAWLTIYIGCKVTCFIVQYAASISSCGSKAIFSKKFITVTAWSIGRLLVKSDKM